MKLHGDSRREYDQQRNSEIPSRRRIAEYNKKHSVRKFTYRLGAIDGIIINNTDAERCLHFRTEWYHSSIVHTTSYLEYRTQGRVRKPLQSHWSGWVCVKVLVRWATGKRLTDRLPKRGLMKSGRFESGYFQTFTGRVGSGRVAFARPNPIWPGCPYPTQPDLTREV